jgi:hypothetical protein
MERGLESRRTAIWSVKPAAKEGIKNVISRETGSQGTVLNKKQGKKDVIVEFHLNICLETYIVGVSVRPQLDITYAILNSAGS